MAESKLVETSWLSYRESVIPRDASSTQVIESRRAFYAGAHTLFNRILVALAPESEPTEADLAMMSGVSRELEEFNGKVKRGLA